LNKIGSKKLIIHADNLLKIISRFTFEEDQRKICWNNELGDPLEKAQA